MKELTTFNNDKFGTVRTVTVEAVPYFVGKDVAEILGYSNPQKAIRDHVADEDKTVNESFTVNGTQGVLINESGLYSLILGSKLPAAKEFKHWVTSEILPAIHKHGLYAIDDILENPDIGIQALQALKEERAKRKEAETLAAVRQQQLLEAKPKATYYDLVLQCPDTVSVSKIAKDYGKSAQWLNELLHEEGVQYKQGDVWLLYQKYADKGYTQSRTYAAPNAAGELHSHMNTYWTQAGRLFIYELLKAKNILPTVERT